MLTPSKTTIVAVAKRDLISQVNGSRSWNALIPKFGVLRSGWSVDPETELKNLPTSDVIEWEYVNHTVVESVMASLSDVHIVWINDRFVGDEELKDETDK